MEHKQRIDELANAAKKAGHIAPEVLLMHLNGYTPEALKLMHPIIQTVIRQGHDPIHITREVEDGVKGGAFNLERLKVIRPHMEEMLRRGEDPGNLAAMLKLTLFGDGTTDATLDEHSGHFREALHHAKQNGHDPFDLFQSVGHFVINEHFEPGHMEHIIGRNAKGVPHLVHEARQGRPPHEFVNRVRERIHK